MEVPAHHRKAAHLGVCLVHSSLYTDVPVLVEIHAASHDGPTPQVFAKAAAANDVELAARELYPDKCAPKPEPEPEPEPAAEAPVVTAAEPAAATAAEPQPAAESTPAPQQNGNVDLPAEVHAEDNAMAADDVPVPTSEPVTAAADDPDAGTPAV